MSGFNLEVTEDETRKLAEIIRRIARGGENCQPENPEPMSSWEMSKIFQCTHTRIFNRIARFISAEAAEDEKAEFTVAEREYGKQKRKHPIWMLTEKGCQIYIDRMCAEERRSKAFVEGLERFKTEIGRRFHGKSDPEEMILMNGRSRTECGYIKDLFDKFITGPAIENREIEELSKKYEEFYRILRSNPADKNQLEDAMMGVAVEAEMQGFIYGFKVFEVLLNKSLAAA
ncbi:MAG: hypothetical protein Q4D60_08010 [Eubacteriales bacterium]|nr:hypothetical protein [Eubacteriales bacterium]